MTRRSIRRTAAGLVTAGLAAGLLGATLGGSASAEVPSGVSGRVQSQVATPPPPGSGVVIIVEQPQPLGPRSFT